MCADIDGEHTCPVLGNHPAICRRFAKAWLANRRGVTVTVEPAERIAGQGDGGAEPGAGEGFEQGWRQVLRSGEKLKKAKEPLFLIDEGEIKPDLYWYEFRNRVLSYAYSQFDEYGCRGRVARDVAAVVLMGVHRLKPRELFRIRWIDLGAAFITLGTRTGIKGQRVHVVVNDLTRTVVKLLKSWRREKQGQGAKVFEFTPRTLQRIVKRILGPEYEPRDLMQIREIPEKLAGEFHLSRSMKELSKDGAASLRTVELFQEEEGERRYTYPTILEHGTSSPSKEKMRRAKMMKVSHYIPPTHGRQ